MEAIDHSTENRALDVLVTAFRNIPGVLRVIKKDKHLTERLRVLCRFCVRISIDKQGAFITSDRKGVALLFSSNARQPLLRLLKAYFIISSYCIGWNRAWNIFKRERVIRSRRPGSEHLYFWMLGVEDNSKGLNTIIEMRDFAFKRSRELQLPIIAETTCEKNLVLYKRYGFKVYDRWKAPGQNICVWFILREWNA